MYYYGYKLHAVCGLSGVIHFFDLTKASVHDIHYLKDVKVDYSNCTVIGDRGYISAQVQLDLFETANIRLEVPYRCNQKEWKPTFPAFAKARKRIETLFSQLCDQFMIIRNYAKDTDGLFAGLSGRLAHLQSSNILTTKMKSLLAELNMRYFNSANRLLQSVVSNRKETLYCSRASDRFPWLPLRFLPHSCHHPGIPLQVCPYGYSFSAILSGPSSVIQFADLAHEFLGRLECRDVVCRNDDGRILRDVAGRLFSTSFEDETAESS